MRLLVTRPEPDAAGLARRLTELGHVALVEPLSEIRPLPFEMPARRFAAVLLTSRHAAGALAGSDAPAALRRLPVWCVGEGTAEAARAAGFAQAEAAGENAASLAEGVIARGDPSAGPLLYARGRDVTGNLGERLGRAGFTVCEVVVYTAPASRRLSSETRQGLIDRSIDGVILMSPRAAETFARLAGLENGPDMVAGVTAYCLSPAVAERLGDLGMRCVVAARPTLDALLGAIGKAAGAPR